MQVLGICDEGNVLVMERGYKSVRQFLDSEERLPLSTCRIWLKDILTAIGFLHRTGIVHFDIKTANFLVFVEPGQASTRSVVKLCDMGLARDTCSSMETDQELMSLWYRAPELLMGFPNFSAKVR